MLASIKFTKPMISRLACPVGKAEAFLGVQAYGAGRRQWIAQRRNEIGRTDGVRQVGMISAEVWVALDHAAWSVTRADEA